MTISLRIYEPTFETIPEQYRAFYVCDPEHGWKLNTDVDEVVSGLKTALRKERETVRELRERLRRIAADSDETSSMAVRAR